MEAVATLAPAQRSKICSATGRFSVRGMTVVLLACLVQAAPAHAQRPARAARLQVARNGDGGPATRADVYPSGVAVDARGNLYISEDSEFESDYTRVRRVSVDGIITTVAGTGTRGFGGDSGPARRALLSGPVAIAVDSAGTIYIVDAVGVQDCFGVRVRRVGSSGIITTVAGGPSGFRQSGDTGCAIFSNRVATAPYGNVYIADQADNRVLLLDSAGALHVAAVNVAGPLASNGRAIFVGMGNTVMVITPRGIARLVGDGTCGTRPDGALGLCASLNRITAIAVDRNNLVYIADSVRVYRWGGPRPVLTTIAGNGSEGLSGDGGPAINATFRHIAGIAVDGVGNLYIADSENRRVRRVDTNGVITSVVGNRRPNPPRSDEDEP
jgi:hypothetical protein